MLEANEQALLQQRLLRTRASRSLTTSAIVASSVLGMILLLLAGGMLKRQLSLSAKSMPSTPHWKTGLPSAPPL